jgi:hypothetical protein
MGGRRLHTQDGFIREILWLAAAIIIIAVLVLDGVSLFTANQSVVDNASRAASEASTSYLQTQDVGAARLAAQQFLIHSNEQLSGFSWATSPSGDMVFTVTAKAHANTYVFKYLRYVGLKKWVNRMSNPTDTGTSN